jgi:branched-chain amino acid transport system permease protein
VLVFAVVYLLLRSRHGLALTAIRDSEPASASLGVNTFRTKFIIYIATAACTGLIGGLIFLQKLRISPEAGFSINDWTVVVIFMVVIGGIGTLEGPFIGMLVYIVLRELLADYGTIYLMLMGAIAIAVMLKAPFGIWGWVVQRYDSAAVSGRTTPGVRAIGATGRVSVSLEFRRRGFHVASRRTNKRFATPWRASQRKPACCTSG